MEASMGKWAGLSRSLTAFAFGMAVRASDKPL